MPHSRTWSRRVLQRAGEAVRLRRALKQTFSIGSTPSRCSATSGHRAAEPLRVLLGDEHGQPEHARALHEHGDVGRHPLEVEHRGPERLLHVDHDQRGARAVELHARSGRPAGSSASRIAKPRSR